MRQLLIFMTVLFSTFAWAEDHVISVAIQAKPERAVFKEGTSLPVTLVISNGFDAPLLFSTFALKPNEWNGETMNVSLVDVYRDGQKKNLYLARPLIEPPRAVSGLAAHTIPPKGKLAVMIDMSKWSIAGGWIKGRYEAAIRVEKMKIDRSELSVLNDPPLIFVIQ